ncbi:hypothetical protein FRB94_002023 [Tulasnella sp. JGI-2019a]|nr:hypothetical protein FRB94_002023 [Tulasnella sp. JGI-2019a]
MKPNVFRISTIPPPTQILLRSSQGSGRCSTVMPPTVCSECQGTIEYVQDVLCYICVSCGVMNLDHNQYELHTSYNDTQAMTWKAPDVPHAHVTHGKGPGGPEKEERWIKNAVAAYGFIRSVLRRMDYEGLYDRVMGLFGAMMQKEGFKWGRTSSTRIIGACVFIAIRESGRGGETVQSVAAVVDVPTPKLSRMLIRTLRALNMKLPTADALGHVPRLLKLVSDAQSNPQSSKLPMALLGFLSDLSLHSVHNLARNIQYVSDSVHLTHNRTPPPVACALVIMAMEGEAGRAAPCLPHLMGFLSEGTGANSKTVSDRYIEFQTLISEWKLELPWLTTSAKPHRKRKTPQREEHASLIKDIVCFQEELWRRRQENERSPELSASSSQATSPLRLELDGEDDVGSGDEALELPLSPSPTIFSVSTIDSETRVGSASSGQMSDNDRPTKKRRLSESTTLPYSQTVSARRSNNSCLRPSYAQRNTRQMDLDIKIERAVAALLGGTLIGGDKGNSTPGQNVAITNQGSIRSQVLAAGVESAAGGTQSLTRLGALSTLVGEANIEDGELFDEGELEAILRSEEEVHLLRRIWDDAESKEPPKVPRNAPRVRTTKQVDAAALEQALTGLKTNIPHGPEDRDATWVAELMGSFEVDEVLHDEDVYHVRTLSSADLSTDLTSATYDPFADFEEL